MVKSVKKKEEGSEREKVKKDRDNKQNKAKANNINVVVRVRPFLSFEAGNRDCVEVLAKGDDGGFNTIQVDGKDKATFTFDAAYPSTSSQSDMFSSIIPLVDACLDGYNATVLAYGQTGSGKTHTILGEVQRSSDGKENEEAGVIPRALREIFSRLKDLQADAVSDPLVKNEYKVKVQFLELYGENIRDLLSEKHSNKSLAIRDGNGSSEPEVIGASEVEVFNADDALLCLTRGTLRRVTRATAMNSESSRSHAIMSVIIHQKSVEEGESSKESVTMSKTSRFHFVDLAGSERAKRTGATGQGMKEGININKGLLVLGNVISALGDPRKRGKAHVPYRDSKLTRLLKGSLGGNHRTLMIACVSPSSSNSEETTNTLRYANRAKNIKNKAEVNIDAGSKLVAELRQQVGALASALIQCGDKTFSPEQLRKLSDDFENVGYLVESSSASTFFSSQSTDSDLSSTNERLKQFLDESKAENKRLLQRLDESQEIIIKLESDLELTQSFVDETTNQTQDVNHFHDSNFNSFVTPMIDDSSHISQLTYDQSQISQIAYETTKDVFMDKKNQIDCDLRNIKNDREICALNIHSHEQYARRMQYVLDCTNDQIMKKDGRIHALEKERSKLNRYNIIRRSRIYKAWSFLSISLSNELAPSDEMIAIQSEIDQMESDCEQFTAMIYDIDNEIRFTKEWQNEMKSAINGKDRSIFLLQEEKDILAVNSTNLDGFQSSHPTIKKITSELDLCLKEQKECTDRFVELKAKGNSLEEKKMKILRELEEKKGKIKSLKTTHINLCKSMGIRSKYIHSIEFDQSLKYDDFPSSDSPGKYTIFSTDYKLRMNKISNDLSKCRKEKMLLVEESKKLQAQISDASDDIYNAKVDLFKKSTEILELVAKQNELISQQTGSLNYMR